MFPGAKVSTDAGRLSEDKYAIVLELVFCDYFFDFSTMGMVVEI